jgi:hypothetical protein
LVIAPAGADSAKATITALVISFFIARSFRAERLHLPRHDCSTDSLASTLHTDPIHQEKFRRRDCRFSTDKIKEE